MAALFKSVYDHKKELLLFAVTNGPACILLNWIFLGKRYFNEGTLFIAASLAIFPFILLLHNIMSVTGKNITRRFPLHTDTLKRNLFTSIASFIVAMACILSAVWVYQLVPLLRFDVTLALFRNIILLVFTVNLVVSSIYMAAYVFDQMKETLVQNESLKKEQLQQQFDNLKTKVNPHFLFNSLSSLSMLVSEDTEKADAFLNEMSKVYRYMLKSNHHEWTELQYEINFINSYFYLLKVRYGQTVSLQVKADEKYNACLLPPLTLYLLLENALQHNVAMKDAPLAVTIETNGDNTITVKNKLQRKKLSLPTAGKGLETLKAKCSLPGFAVNETANEFMVTVPLQYNTETPESIHG